MAAAKASGTAPKSAPKATPKATSKGPAKGTVLNTLTHAGTIIEPGEKVPDDLSDEAVAILVAQGHVQG